MVVLRPLASLDAWWHLSMGREVWRTKARRFPDPVGPDSREYVDPEWLYDLLLYGVHGLGGVPAVLLMTGVLAALGAALLLRDDDEGGLVLAALGAAGATFHFTGRPQAAFLVLLPLTLWLGHQRRPVLLVLTGLLWSQVHSSMVIFPLVAALSLRPRDRRDLATLAACALVPLAGPFGLEVVGQVFGHARVEGVHDMAPMPAEGWLPWGMLEHNRSFAPLILELLLLLGVAGAVKARRVDPWDLGLALLGLALALSARRFVAAGCLLALPWAAPLLRRGLPRGSGWLALLGFVAYGSWLRPPSLALDPSSVPVGAGEVLAELPAGQLYNDYDVGGYLGWATPHRVSIDGRTPTHFSAEELAAALAINQDPTGFSGDYVGVVVDRRAPLCQALFEGKEWGGVWSGEQVAVFLPGVNDRFPVCAGPNEMLAHCWDPGGLVLTPGSHHARRLLALHAVECSGDLDAGWRWLDEAEAIQPAHPENTWIRGLLALRGGDPEEALYWFERAPGHPPSARAAEVVRGL